MNILYITDFYKPNKGGIEILLEQIINHFSKRHTIYVITWNFSGNLPEVEKKGNVTIYRIKAKNLFTYTLNAYKKAKEIISNIDIIHGNTWFSALVAGKLAKKYNKKTIIHVHGLFGNFRNFMIEDKNFLIKKLKVWKFKILENLIIKQKVDYFVAISYFVRDILEFYYGVKNIEIIHNGIDEKKWLSYIDENKISKIKEEFNLENKYNILFYGRIEKLKGWDFFLETIPSLNLENTNYIFIVHGNFKKFTNKLLELNLIKENIQNKLESKKKVIIKNNLAKNSNFIIIPGLEHSEIGNWIKASSLVVIPSLMEPFGLVGLETSLLETPIVAANTGALHEVVFGKVNFFQTGHKNSLKEAILKSKYGEFIQIPYRNYSLENMVSKLEILYSK